MVIISNVSLTKFDTVVYIVLELCALVYDWEYVLRVCQSYVLEYLNQQQRSLLHYIGYVEHINDNLQCHTNLYYDLQDNGVLTRRGDYVIRSADRNSINSDFLT